MRAGNNAMFNCRNNNLHYMVRRGMIQTVGDIFELTVPLSDEILQRLHLNVSFIKRFRHTASHSYGLISNEIAHACITHCIDKKIVDKVREILEEAEKAECKPETQQ